MNVLIQKENVDTIVIIPGIKTNVVGVVKNLEKKTKGEKKMIDVLMLYSCCRCGETLSGLEWHENSGGDDKEYTCPTCKEGLNEDELYSEED